MSRWLIFLVVLVLASEWREGPEEFACDVVAAAIAYWYWRKLWYDIR